MVAETIWTYPYYRVPMDNGNGLYSNENSVCCWSQKTQAPQSAERDRPTREVLQKTTRLPPEGVGFFLELHMDDGNGRHGRGINHRGGSPR